MSKAPHPFAYTLLIVPFGAMGGFVSVALTFLASKQGMGEADVAELAAIGVLPHTWKFLWAPVADTTLTRRAWYVLSSALCVVGILAIASIPLDNSTLALMKGVIFTANLATTTLGMAVEGMMAHLTPAEERGRVGGWFQAGNLGGSGIGGGVGLWLMTHLPSQWMAGAIMGVLFALCGLAMLRLPDVPADSREAGLGTAIANVGRDLYAMIRTRGGQLCALLCVLPIGTGAASGILAQASVAGHWSAGEAEVGMVNGILSGFIMAGGCFLGGLLCTRWPARSVYAAIGALMAATTATMALSPATPTTFVGFGLFYALVVGLAYAAFTGFVLEAMGTGAAATKYNLFASLSNFPIWYMTLLLGMSAESRGAVGMLWTESLFGVVGLVVLGIGASLLRRRNSDLPVGNP